MDMKLVNKLLLISSILILIAGVIFLGISIFGDVQGTSALSIALVCVFLSNLLNLIRVQFLRKE